MSVLEQILTGMVAQQFLERPTRPVARNVVRAKKPRRPAPRRSQPTNHDRVVAGRARRLGISVKEYKARFC